MTPAEHRAEAVRLLAKAQHDNDIRDDTPYAFWRMAFIAEAQVHATLALVMPSPPHIPGPH